tara:strand:+ start:889 stop:1353 length:465 start_codon:yes stop_codon:yes gene_type:complete
MTEKDPTRAPFPNFLEEFIAIFCEGLISLESVATQLSKDSAVVEETPHDMYIQVLRSVEKIDPTTAHHVYHDCEEALYFQNACLTNMDPKSLKQDWLLNRFTASMLAFALASDTRDDLSFCLSPLLDIASFAMSHDIIDFQTWDELFRYAYSKR